jgi:hypothetical protein
MLLDADRQQMLAQLNTHFVVSQSVTHQISHTKSFVADGKVGAEGSGEGTFVLPDKDGGSGFKAQNSTHTIFPDPDSVRHFQPQLIAEHMAAQNQATPDEQVQRKAPARRTK